MPLMIGNTKEEGDMFIHMIFNKAVPGWEYDATLVALFHLNALKGLFSCYPFLFFPCISLELRPCVS